MKNNSLFRIACAVLLTAFIWTGALPPAYAQALLPDVGAEVGLSLPFTPAALKGVKVHFNDPLKLDFILDHGDGVLAGRPEPERSDEARRLVKYFFAALTVPEKDLWVNLSPYEKARIIPEKLGQTDMGRDLLAQDYLLKQITASLMDPREAFGKKFWDAVYKESYDKFGTTDIPVDTFNKVWIMPAKAVIYERPDVAGAALGRPLDAAAFVVESRLKVMLESDYLAMSNQPLPTGGHVAPQGYVSPSTLPNDPAPNVKATEGSDRLPSIADIELTKNILRSVIIPVLEKEVNEGKNFAQLRQVYQSLILAAWYKKKIRQSLLSAIYVDQNKVAGINSADPKEAEKIWAQYVASFKKGAYDLIREDKDPLSGEMTPRRYFSGGVILSVDPESVDSIDPKLLAHPADILHVQGDVFFKDSAQSILIEGGEKILNVQGRQVRLVVKKISVPHEMTVDVFIGDEKRPGSFDFGCYDQAVTISHFFPLSRFKSRTYADYNNQGVADAILQWLIGEADLLGFKVRNSGTMTLPLVHLYLRYFGDRISVAGEQWQNVLSYMQREGFYSSTLWGKFNLKKMQGDQEVDVGQSFRLTRAGSTGERYIVSDVLGAQGLKDGQMVEINKGAIYADGEKTSFFINEGSQEVRVEGMPIGTGIDLKMPVSPEGGIDLNSLDQMLEARGDGTRMLFENTPQLLMRYKMASGLRPVITGIEPVTDFSAFWSGRI